MKKIGLISLLFILAFELQSCKKAGLGGDATLVVFPAHHGNSIYGATVYVKFNTKDSPGSSLSDYDATFVGDPKSDFVNVTELMQGNYYLYAIGYDSSISALCYGGQNFTIKRKDKSDSRNVEISITE
jgi:hypothetical protein